MKRQFFILIAIAAFSTALTTSAFGQTGKTIRANVKFDFQIGGRNFPAGEYLIEQISRQSDNILQIRSASAADENASRKQIIIANLANPGKRQSPKLVFQKYGEIYFLTEIFLDTEAWGYKVRPSRKQRENEKYPFLASSQTVEVRVQIK